MGSLAEINLYGTSSQWLVSVGVKLLTLRLDKPKYSSLLPGSNLIIRYEFGFDLGVVFSRDLKPLRDYTPEELLLDGYMSADEALTNLRTFPGYENSTQDTPILGLGISTSSHLFSYLDREKSQMLLNTPLIQSIHMPEFRSLFMPSYLWWAVLREDQQHTRLSVTKWHKLLSQHLRMFDDDTLKKVRTLDEPTKVFYDRIRHTAIKDVLKYSSTASSKYRSLVLCEPISIGE